MKKLYRSISTALKYWPTFHRACIFALIVVSIEILVMAVLCQIESAMPTISTFNALFWKWKLPFGMSLTRTWDFLLIPILFLSLTYLNEKRREDARERLGDYGFPILEEDGTSIVDANQITLNCTLVLSSIFGFIYFIPLYVAIYISLFVFSIIMLIACSISEWHSRRKQVQ